MGQFYSNKHAVHWDSQTKKHLEMSPSFYYRKTKTIYYPSNVC